MDKNERVERAIDRLIIGKDRLRESLLNHDLSDDQSTMVRFLIRDLATIIGVEVSLQGVA